MHGNKNKDFGRIPFLVGKDQAPSPQKYKGLGDHENCGACVLTRTGPVTHSVRVRSTYGKQGLNLDEPLCREPSETEEVYFPRMRLTGNRD